MPFIDSRILHSALAAAILSAPLIPSAHAAPQKRGSSAARRAAPAGYRLGARDAIRVSVKDFPEFNVDSVVIPPDGVVSMPFYGTVRVGGKTTSQVASELRRILLRELKAPIVSVTITEFRSLIVGRAFLVGSVAAPGPVDLREGTRLTEVLATAGSLGGRVEEKRATLTRGNAAPVTLDLAGALARPNSAANVRVQPGDVITFTSVEPGRITVSGDVARGDTFEMHRNPVAASRELGLAPRLSDAILLAGGLGRAGSAPDSASPEGAPGGTPGASSTSGANGAFTGVSSASPSTLGGAVRYSGTLQRAGSTRELNVEEALRDVSGIYNIPLRAGDFITVKAILPPPPIRVHVDGFVNRVGPVTVPPGTRLLQVLSEAGGLTQTADKVVASVRRGNQTIPIDLQSVMLNIDSEANIELQPGDTLQIREPEVIRVTAAGSLAKPGPLRLKPNSTLLEALIEAGNLSIKAEDARLSVLRKEADGTQRIINADPVDLLELRSVKDNLVLREGDVVNVSPVRMQTIFVQGEVNSPGAFEVREGEGLIELITRAGGVKETAALTQVVVDRGGQTISADVYDAIKSGRPLVLPLQKGDRVTVPANPNRVLVLEAVSRPGPLPIPERGRLTLAGALGEAGGPSQKSKEVVLVRRVGAGLQERKFKMSEVRSGAAGQTALQNGDVLYVPATEAKPGLLQRILPAVSLFGFLR